MFRKYSVGVMNRWLSTVVTTAMAPVSSTDMVTALRSPGPSSAPKRWEMRMEKPWVKPMMMPSTIQFSQSAAPREASASTPIKRPTTMVSTMV